jgi:hypothetical protein
MARPASKHPTELELEILKILWRDGPCNVRGVVTRLAPAPNTGWAPTRSAATCSRACFTAGASQCQWGWPPRAVSLVIGVLYGAIAGFVGGRTDNLMMRFVDIMYSMPFIIFVILVVINFVVITRGSGRIAEVAARFTLDAMPGKQMSIDADLNAGLIDDREARKALKKDQASIGYRSWKTASI